MIFIVGLIVVVAAIVLIAVGISQSNRNRRD